jgi:regulatory protein
VSRSGDRAGAAARGRAGAVAARSPAPGPPPGPAGWAVPGIPAEPASVAPAGQAPAGQAPAGQAAAREAIARQICLRMLTAAPRTRAQLAEALRQRGIPEETAEAVLRRFGEVKLIDDAAFAAAWVESRHHGRGLAGRALASELRNRGVPAEYIKAAVGGLDPEQEIATARGLVARRLASTRGQPLNARVRRLAGLLARKGYAPAIAYRVVREALRQEGLDPAAAGIDLDDPPDAEAAG